MPAKKNIITEATLIPVSLLVVIVGVVFWFASVHAKALATESALTEETSERVRVDQRIVDRIGRLEALMNDTHAATARVEGKVDVLLRR